MIIEFVEREQENKLILNTESSCTLCIGKKKPCKVVYFIILAFIKTSICDRLLIAKKLILCGVSRTEKDKYPYDIAYMWNIKKNTNKLISKIETHTYRKQNCGYQSGNVGGKDKLGVWDKHIHIAINKIDNQQGPTVYHRELYAIICNNV